MQRLLFFLLLNVGLSIFLSAAPPDCNAPNITINRTTWSSFDPSINSGLPKPPCALYLGYDKLFRFTATSSVMTINIIGARCDPAFQVFSGKCPDNMVPIACVPSRNCGLNPNPALTLTVLNPGEEYFIRVWTETPPIPPIHWFSIVVSDQSLEAFYDVVGSAQTGSPNNDCATVTNGANQKGCAFYTQQAANNMEHFPMIDLTFTLNFGNAGAASKNGMCFVLTTNYSACGSPGYGIGAEGIPNSVIVEFDTWDDGTANTPDIADDHITLFINGDFTTAIAGPFTVPGLANFADGADHEFRFIWDPAIVQTQVEFDGNLIFTHNGTEYISQCFGGAPFQLFRSLRFGFTSSTGDEAETHTVCYDPHFHLRVPLNETISKTICDGFSYTSPNGTVYSAAGNFTETFTGSNGCQATRTINIYKQPIPTKTLNIFVCDGDNFNGYTESGTYNYTKSGVSCDTAITLKLTKIDFDVFVNKVNDINCSFEETSVYAIIPNLPVNPSFDPTVIYDWITPDGTIASGQGTDGIIVKKGGTYFLQVTVKGESSGVPYNCIILSDPVVVLENYEKPNAVVSSIGQLSCMSDNMSLDGGLSTAFPLSFTWSTVGGGFIGSINNSFVSINKPGSYLLTVTNEISGCTDTASIKIAKAGFATTAQLTKTSDIDCTNDTIALDAMISDSNYDHLAWTTPDGNILTDTSNNKIFVNKAGEYFLTLFDDNDCESVISIVVAEELNYPLVNAGLDNILNCDKTSVNLQGSVTTTSTNYTFQWKDANENILSENQLQLNVTEPGWYVFSSIDSINHCRDVDSVLINIDKNYPVLNSITDQKLTCQQLFASLNGNVSNQGSNMVYTWSTTGGNFTGPLDALITSADQVGQYQLIAENADNGCSDTIQLNVTGSIDQPIATAGSDVTLDCHNPFSNAEGTYTSNDAANNIQIAWSTIGGNIQGPVNGLNINVASPGLYIISVTNTLNGCADSDTLLVVKNDDKPVINFENVIDLTCITSTIDITPLWTNAGIDPTITWQTIGGNIITVNPDSVIQVNKAGEYNLTVVNEETGCITTGGVIVTENKTEPEGNVLPPGELTCTVKNIQIEFVPDPGGNYTYSWSTTGGNINGSSVGSVINVDKAGNYVLDVTDNDNGCKSKFSANVNISNDFPGVSAGANDALTCIIQTVTLNGVVQNVTDYNATWQAISGGNIVSGGNTLKPVIDQAGIYILQINDNVNGCMSTDTVEIIANITEPEFVAPNIKDADCLGKDGSISFADIDNANEPYTFKVNGKAVTSSDLIFDGLNSGSYTIEVIDANGCETSFDGEIGKATEVTMTLPDTLLLIYGQSYSGLSPEFQFDTTGMTLGNWTGANYLDCTNCLNPTLKPTSSATLSFSVTSAEGCLAQDQVYIRVRKKEGDFFIPNSFSPGDRNGINDFITVFTDSYTIPLVDEFRIFNRWGTEVFGKTNFRPNDEQLGWNGYYNGSICNPGVYVYFAKFKTIDGDPILAKGDITIIK